MKRSRALYFHPETNSGKIRALEALHGEYRRYLQACIDEMVQKRRMSIPKGELLRFFPVEKTLSTNIVTAIQSHAVEIVRGWTASTYTRLVKPEIKILAKEGEIDEAAKITLFTIGKYAVDRESDTVSAEMIERYWTVLLGLSKAPTASPRIGMRMSLHTSTMKLAERTLSHWWLGVSTLTKSKTIKVPLLSNPHVSSPEEVVRGCMIRKDRQGRWRVEVLEKRLVDDPIQDLQAPRVGVDVGLNVLAATSDGRLYGKSVKPKFNRLYVKARNVRSNRQRQGFKENSRRLDRMEERLSGLVKTATGTIANRLVRGYPGHTFVVEDLDLKGCKGQKRFAYRALHASLSKKASVLTVNPAYTSQMCPRCGYTSRSNRSEIKFKCRSCGKIHHADVVGAINLLGRSEDRQVGCDDHHLRVRTLLRDRYRLRRDRSSGGEIAPVWPGQRLTTGILLGTASNAP